MIVTAKLEFPIATLYIATKSVIISGQQYEASITKIGSIEREMLPSKDYSVSGIDISIVETAGYFQAMFAVRANARIDGKTVTIRAYDEALTLIHTYIGVVEKYSMGVGVFNLTVSDRLAPLDKTYPTSSITAAVYPDAVLGAIGKSYGMIFGTFTVPTGSIRAWKIGGGKYLLASVYSIRQITGVFENGVSISTTQWTLVRGASYDYIYYPTGTQDYISVNMIGAYYQYAGINYTIDWPVICLEDVLDNLSISYDATSFAAVDAIFDTLAYKLCGAFEVLVKVREILAEFCRSYNCYWYIGNDGKICMGVLDPAGTPVKSFANGEINTLVETGYPDEIVNKIHFKYQFDYVNAKYNLEDYFVHSGSIAAHGEKTAECELLFNQEKPTIQNALGKMLTQLKDRPSKIVCTLALDKFKTAAGVYLELGDLISVTDSRLLSSGACKYQIIKENKGFYTEIASFTAKYVEQQIDYFIQASAGANGIISPSGIVAVAAGEHQIFTFTPNADYTVAHVYVDGVDQGVIASYEFVDVAADHTISVDFVSTKHKIAASAGPNGTIDPTGDVMVTEGTNKTFNAYPASGFAFDYFLVDGIIQTANPYTFTNVTADHILVAFFYDPTWYQITVTINGSGTCSPDDQLVSKGRNYDFEFFPAVGYHVLTCKIDGVSQGAITKGSIVNVQAAHTIEVWFEADTASYNVVATFPGAGHLHPGVGTFSYLAGSSPVFECDPTPGYYISYLEVDGTPISPVVDTYTFANIAANHTIYWETEAS